MAALMTASMVLIENSVNVVDLQIEEAQHRDHRVGVLMLTGSWFGIRQQAAIGDRQFLRSMIAGDLSFLALLK